MGTQNGILGEPKWVFIKFIHMYTEAQDQRSTQTKQMLVQIVHFLKKPPRVVAVVMAMAVAVAAVVAVAVAAVVRMVYSGKCVAGEFLETGKYLA